MKGSRLNWMEMDEGCWRKLDEMDDIRWMKSMEKMRKLDLKKWRTEG